MDMGAKIKNIQTLFGGNMLGDRAFQQWNDGARKDKGLRLDKCRFTVEV